MEISKNHWLFNLYKSGSSFGHVKDRRNRVNAWTCGRRVVFGNLFILYLSILKLIGICILIMLIEIPAAVFSLIANFVTVPLGIGISEVHPDTEFLRIPFLVTVGTEKMNLAWFLIPFWMGIVNVWFMIFGIENLVSVIVWVLSIVSFICYILAINLAQKGELIVEFVEPKEEINQSPA